MGIAEYLGAARRPPGGIAGYLGARGPRSIGEYLARSRTRDLEDWGFEDAYENPAERRRARHYAHDIVAAGADDARPHDPGYHGRGGGARGYPSPRDLRRSGDLCKCPRCGHRYRHALEKARGERAYDAGERREVRREKTQRYGKGETFAVPSLRSYPLTKNGRPSRERTMAAWRYMSMPKNAAKLGDEVGAAKRRIRAFARRHFGERLGSSSAA